MKRTCQICGTDISHRPHLAKFCEQHAPKKAAPKRASLREAVDAMCKACIYDPVCQGTWRKQVEECTSPDCPLYPVRPTTI